MAPTWAGSGLFSASRPQIKFELFDSIQFIDFNCNGLLFHRAIEELRQHFRQPTIPDNGLREEGYIEFLAFINTWYILSENTI